MFVIVAVVIFIVCEKHLNCPQQPLDMSLMTNEREHSQKIQLNSNQQSDDHEFDSCFFAFYLFIFFASTPQYKTLEEHHYKLYFNDVATAVITVPFLSSRHNKLVPQRRRLECSLRDKCTWMPLLTRLLTHQVDRYLKLSIFCEITSIW